MRDPLNDLRMRMKEALDNLWARITGKFDTVHGRVDDAEAHIDDVEGELNATKGRVTSVEGRMTTAEGQITGLNTRVGNLEDAVDDLDGAMIKSITFNGTAVPKDAQGNVALQETDPTVPAWAKQVKAKTSDLTNDGDGSDNNSPFATQEYVRVNGGKIDEVQVNGTALPIVNKAVNVPVPTLISQLINDVGFTKDSIVEVDYGGQYISEIYPYLIDKIGNEEIRRFRANILRIGLLTNHEINVDVWGFIYRWDENNADDDIWFTMVCYEEYSGNACYYARVYSNERDYQREIVHVDTVFQFGSGGGGSGAVDTITFNGVTYQPDANGNVSFGFAETDPTVPAWAKAAQKPSYTASEVGAKPTQTAVADPTASGTAAAFIDTISQNAQGVITATKKSVTPANIGALAISGGTMSGDIDMGQAGASSGAPSVKWRTADGTLFSFRPYGNAFQLVRGEGSSASSVLAINSDGTLYVNPQANWRSALGVVPSIVSLTAGANVSVAWQSNVAVSGVLIFNSNVTVNSAITGSGIKVLTLPSGYKAASQSNPFLVGRFGGATHQLYMAANSGNIITGFGATNIPVGDYVLSGVILLG